MLYGQWSPIKRQYGQQRREVREKPKNSIENNEMLRLLPNRLLPVHRHLRQQLEKELQQAPLTESRDEERTKDSQPGLWLSSTQSKLNFQKTVSVSVDGVDKSEGRWRT